MEIWRKISAKVAKVSLTNYSLLDLNVINKFLLLYNNNSKHTITVYVGTVHTHQMYVRTLNIRRTYVQHLVFSSPPLSLPLLSLSFGMSAHFADFSSLLLLLAEPYKKKRHSVHPSPLSDRCGSCLPHSLGYCSWFNRSLVFSLCISQDPLERTSGRVFALRVCAESFDSSLTHHSPLRSSMAKIGSVVQVLLYVSTSSFVARS